MTIQLFRTILPKTLFLDRRYHQKVKMIFYKEKKWFSGYDITHSQSVPLFKIALLFVYFVFELKTFSEENNII